ncbi:hypothetical protein ACI76W_06370 [Capnocytophaga canimorsus]|uniref:hypothetical protein n=1 Tax=Capnocytophaga canimorsus TaxID=28188 RepID=UPI00385D69F5
MKKILLGLLTIWFFVLGCQDSKTKEKDKTKIAIENAQNSEQIEKEIFLGFKFGMTESEVSDHFKILLGKGKVYTIGGQYQYDLTTDTGANLRLNFITKFHEGKLYELICEMRERDLSVMSGDMVFMAASSSFHNSERSKNFKTYHIKDDFGDFIEILHIKDNLIVSFYGSVTGKMKYSNAPIAKKIMDIETEHRNKKVKESSSDF